MIEIIGAGVIGCAFGYSLIAKGYSVCFVDCSAARVDGLRRLGHEAQLPDSKPSDAHFYFLCVPTPTLAGCQNLDALRGALVDLGQRLQAGVGSTVAIRSTILPGTTRQVAIPLLEQSSGLKHGQDFNVVFFPEFLREQQAKADAFAPRLHIIGEVNPSDSDDLACLLRIFPAPIMRLSAEAAELQKYVHNCYNAAKISFFNEMRLIATHLDVGHEIESIFAATRITAEAIWNPAYGTKDLGPFSGSCLPKDLSAILQWLEERGDPSLLLQSVWNSNNYVHEGLLPKREAP